MRWGWKAVAAMGVPLRTLCRKLLYGSKVLRKVPLTLKMLMLWRSVPTRGRELASSDVGEPGSRGGEGMGVWVGVRL